MIWTTRGIRACSQVSEGPSAWLVYQGQVLNETLDLRGASLWGFIGVWASLSPWELAAQGEDAGARLPLCPQRAAHVLGPGRGRGAPEPAEGPRRAQPRGLRRPGAQTVLPNSHG